jgi:hypothetical protein
LSLGRSVSRSLSLPASDTSFDISGFCSKPARARGRRGKAARERRRGGAGAAGGSPCVRVQKMS